MGRLVKADRKVTVMQITTHYNSGIQKSISEHPMHQTSKWIGYRRPICQNTKANKYLIKCSLSEFTVLTAREQCHGCGFTPAELSVLSVHVCVYVCGGQMHCVYLSACVHSQTWCQCWYLCSGSEPGVQ